MEPDNGLVLRAMYNPAYRGNSLMEAPPLPPPRSGSFSLPPDDGYIDTEAETTTDNIYFLASKTKEDPEGTTGIYDNEINKDIPEDSETG